MLLNLFQVRLRARDVPEDHVAEGTVRAEPSEMHPGEDTEVIVDLAFPEGGPPSSIDVKVSPPEDFHTSEPVVEIGEESARVIIPASTQEEVELGTYYLQVVYSDGAREHFEVEGSLEVKRHWVRIGDVQVIPSRASLGDPVDVSVHLGFLGGSRVRGYVRGRLVPEDWDGEDDHTIKLTRARCSIAGSKDQVWQVRLPRTVPESVYHADIEFSSGEGTARRRSRGVMRLVPEWGLEASVPIVTPALLSPGDPVVVSTRAENVGRESLEARVGGDLVPEAGGAGISLEEQTVSLGPGEVRHLEWNLEAPNRPGNWMVKVRARADKVEGSDPSVAIMDVRLPNMINVVGALPSRPWASPGETVDVTLRVTDAGSRPGCEARVMVVLEGERGETSQVSWEGPIDREEREVQVTVRVPSSTDGGSGGAPSKKGSDRFALVVLGGEGEELLRVPSAVAVRKRVRIIPRIIKTEADPTKVGDALLPGEKVVKATEVAGLTVMELSSGSRVYTRGDMVVGVDPHVPMDDAFWDEALDADLSLYTDTKEGLELGANAAMAEAIALRALSEELGPFEASTTGIIKDSRDLVRTFDPDRRPRGLSPRSGPLAPLASWLSNPDANPETGRELVRRLKQELETVSGSIGREEAIRIARAAARAAADHLDRYAELLVRVIEMDLLDVKSLRAITALVAAAGVTQLELERVRETADPWITPSQAQRAAKVTLQALSVQLASLLELEARHRFRKAACIANIRQRAAHAAVARELKVEIPVHSGHSGEATDIQVHVLNRSFIDLDLRFNVALPSGTWAVLEPQGRGNRLVSVGPIHIPAGTQQTVHLVLYIPTTVKLDAYVLPVEVVPEQRDLIPEQKGGRS